MTDTLFDITDRVAIVTGGLGQIGVEFSLGCCAAEQELRYFSAISGKL